MNIIGTYNNTKSILSQTIEWINVLSTMYLIGSLILPFNLQKPAIYVYTISTIADIIVNKRYANVKWRNAKWSFAAMTLFYLCMWIWHIFEDCTSTIYFHSTDIRLPFIAFGLLGLTCNTNSRIKIIHIAYTMLAMSVGIIIWLAINIFANNPSTIDSIRELLPSLRLRNLHVTHIELNIYLNSTIAMCFICILENKKWWNRIICIIGISIIYTSLLINEGRVGFITTNILLSFFVGLTIYRYNPQLLIPFLSIFSIAVCIIISSHARFELSEIIKDPRNKIWELSLDIIKEKPIFGHGVCEGKQLIIEKTTNSPDLNYFWDEWNSIFPDYNKNRFHCHNVFLESAIEFGIIGLVLTISIFLLPILLTKKKRQLYLFIFIIIFGIQAMFETFTFHSQPILFCWIIFFFINITLENRNQM